jgi:hypothetical protein
MTAIFENTAKYHAYKAVVLDKIAPAAMDMDDAYRKSLRRPLHCRVRLGVTGDR